jgi:hypothetical protein
MKKLIFILFSTFCLAQTDQYKEILLSKKVNAKVTSYQDGYGTIYNRQTRNESIVDSFGNITYTSPINSSILHLFKNRFVLYLNEKNYKRKEGIIDEKGKVLIFPDYQNLGSWSNSKSRIIITKNNKDGLFDYDGNQIIPFLDKIESANDDRFFVKKDEYWQLYNIEGKQITETKFRNFKNFTKGKALVTNDKDQSEIIDNQGNTIKVFLNFKINNIESYPFLVTIKNDKYGLIDTDENLIAKEEYNSIFPSFLEKDSFIYLEKDNKQDVFSVKENKLYNTQYRYLNFLFQDYFSTYNEKTLKMGLIKMDNEVVFPQEYDLLEYYRIQDNDFIFLEKDNKQKLLDNKFNPIIDKEFHLIAVFPTSLIIKLSDKYYNFNPKNKELNELKNIVWIKNQNITFYSPIENYSTPLVCKNRANLYGIIDENQKEIIPFIYDDIITFTNNENQIVLKKGNKFGVSNYEYEPLKEIEYDSYQWKKEYLQLKKGNKLEFINFTREKLKF